MRIIIHTYGEGSVDLWGTERTCEKEIMVRASVRKTLNKIQSNYK